LKNLLRQKTIRPRECNTPLEIAIEIAIGIGIGFDSLFKGSQRADEDANSRLTRGGGEGQTAGRFREGDEDGSVEPEAGVAWPGCGVANSGFQSGARFYSTQHTDIREMRQVVLQGVPIMNTNNLRTADSTPDLPGMNKTHILRLVAQ
jgi:hypothetical protein